ncbi:hypothetical protein AN639_02355 [Candidatus Epulonipiscium fishelsonii]|uniref:Uncharacterized protein n=1 Tax=Candidatus Epulonipiscium fishelsonii TaxID=77094 RepID=A0ACC8X9A7_9FIRM|nr:hypothetical protein AN396_09820 [Epulopiscium sp. SCG-B11WGA-EpuloA1]ONI42285.1 hypothetical protein AN639_02355 [Epulopiscium sp. SCG-B05WGA-EpuloA1]
MKKKILVMSAYCIGIVGFIIIVGYFFMGNPILYINKYKLTSAIRTIDDKTITLNEVVPFEWETIYSFGPYSNKEHMEEVIGFESDEIYPNNISEDMVDLIFVQDGEVVARVLEYPSKLGYKIQFVPTEEFVNKIEFKDETAFNVEKANGIVTLDMIEA